MPGHRAWSPLNAGSGGVELTAPTKPDGGQRVNKISSIEHSRPPQVSTDYYADTLCCRLKLNIATRTVSFGLLYVLSNYPSGAKGNTFGGLAG